MNTKDLAERNLIYKVRSGSHAYGTSLPTSDVDFAGIFIPPVEYYFGLQAFDILSEQTEEDKSYYSLRKYAHLAVANNPNVLELLFVDDRDVCLATPASHQLRLNRHLFLSQRCQKTFVGYAQAQLHRIRIHTKWLSQELHDMSILGQLIIDNKVTQEWVAWRFGDNMLKRAGEILAPEFWFKGPMENEPAILELFKSSSIICPDKSDDRFNVRESETRWAFQKHIYDEAKKKRDQYVTWMAERNPKRHESELKFGYDTKHAMHLIRLLRMGYEILTEGELRVRRPDAAELLDIRAGKWTYEQVTEYADEMVAKIDDVGQPGGRKPSVPPTADINKINTVVIRMTQDYLSGYHGDTT